MKKLDYDPKTNRYTRPDLTPEGEKVLSSVTATVAEAMSVIEFPDNDREKPTDYQLEQSFVFIYVVSALISVYMRAENIEDVVIKLGAAALRDRLEREAKEELHDQTAEVPQAN